MTQILQVGQEPPPLGRRASAKPVKKATANRFWVLNTFVDFSLAQLSRAEIAVWMILYRDTKEGTARTSFDDMARRAGCDRRSVTRAVGRLEELGLLKVVYRGGFRKGISSYRVNPQISQAVAVGT